THSFEPHSGKTLPNQIQSKCSLVCESTLQECVMCVPGETHVRCDPSSVEVVRTEQTRTSPGLCPLRSPPIWSICRNILFWVPSVYGEPGRLLRPVRLCASIYGAVCLQASKTNFT